MTLKPKAMDFVISTQDVKSASEVFEFQANSASEHLVENFRFPEEEDILFALELSSDSESVCDLFWNTTKHQKVYRCWK